jgi:hypothetical protein
MTCSPRLRPAARASGLFPVCIAAVAVLALFDSLEVQIAFLRHRNRAIVRRPLERAV